MGSFFKYFRFWVTSVASSKKHLSTKNEVFHNGLLQQVTKSALSCGFSHICSGNPYWKTAFFVQRIYCQSVNYQLNRSRFAKKVSSNCYMGESKFFSKSFSKSTRHSPQQFLNVIKRLC